MNLKKIVKNKGFTLIEILVVIGIIAILAAIVIIAINPAKQFAQARNTQRTSNVNSILNAIGQRMADNKGVFEGEFKIGIVTYTCGPLPTTDGVSITTDEASDTTTKTGDLGCLVPTYISALPTDPTWVDADDEDTLYNVIVGENCDGGSNPGRVSVFAPLGDEPAIPDSDVICVTR
jgi:type IV pilus assembly protein PilA